MTTLLTNQATSIDTAMQTSTGPVVIAASGDFNGASLGIMLHVDGLDPTPAALFRKAGSEIIDLPAGATWFARLVVRNSNPHLSTSVDLSVTSVS